MTCPRWCAHRTRLDAHRVLNLLEGTGPPAIEHMRQETTGPLDSGAPIALELLEVVQATEPGTDPNDADAAVRTTEGPGVSLLGLGQDATSGRILTARDARALARVLERAAARLEGPQRTPGHVIELRPRTDPEPGTPANPIEL